jgi:hypothetical protein
MNEARTLERLLVDSSAFKSIGYDAAREILAIEFQSGMIRHYRGVPLDVFEALGQAESKGRYYAASIKNRYPVEPMTGLCPKCGATGFVGELCVCGASTVRSVDTRHK